MDIDRQKQSKVIAHTNQLLHNTENKRVLLRFQRGVVDLENNRFSILQNSEFVDKLIEYLFTLYKKGHIGNTIKVLEKIGFCACSADQEHRERAVFILSVFTEKVSREKESAEFLEVVSRLLVNWLKIETEYLSGFEFVCTQLQKILQRMLNMGLWYQAENLIIILFQIQTGIIQKNNLIRQMITKVHSGLAEESFLRNLVDVYLDKQEDRRDIAECLLVHFGSKAAVFLVQALIECQDREKRFALIELIPTTGKSIIPVLDRCLEMNPPWYVVRNIIIIISRMDDPTLYAMVRPFLIHKDIRVQQQVLNCISRMGGNQMRERLIEALTYINDELKQQVVIQLGNMGGKDVGDALCALLEKRNGFARHIQDELLLAICTKIKFIPSKRSLDAIKSLIAERSQRFEEGDKILQAAQDALLSLELKSTEAKPASSLPVTLIEPEVPELDQETLIIDSLFSTSEELTATAPGDDTQLEEPVASSIGKGFAAEKSLADPITANHFNIWTELYEQMTTEEFTAFHAALNHRKYQAGETIVNNGDIQAPLFFFDHGAINLVKQQDGAEIYLSPIGAGDLIGSDIFLSGDAWNLSLTAREESMAHVFDLEDLLKLQVDYPHLAEKLFSFCSSFDVLPVLLRVLDEPDEVLSETARLHRDGILAQKTKGQGGQPTGTILKKLKGGLCFSIVVDATEKIEQLLDGQIRLGVRLASGAVRSLPSTIIGAARISTDPERAMVFAQFAQPLNELNYKCENIEFSESV
jgi:CRP-like cAMP-binding protein